MDANELLDRFDQNIAVGKAFGPAYERDGATVIPVAIVAGGGGGGGGSGSEGEKGEGGGFGGVVYPIGVYVVREGDARFVPSVNASRLAASVLGALGIVANRALRRRRVAGRARATSERPATHAFGRAQGWRVADSRHRHRGGSFRLAHLLHPSSAPAEHPQGE